MEIKTVEKIFQSTFPSLWNAILLKVKKMPPHVLSTNKELSILLVRLSFGLKQTKKSRKGAKNS